jgi:hypothetical protein
VFIPAYREAGVVKFIFVAAKRSFAFLQGQALQLQLFPKNKKSYNFCPCKFINKLI